MTRCDDNSDRGKLYGLPEFNIILCVFKKTFTFCDCDIKVQLTKYNYDEYYQLLGKYYQFFSRVLAGTVKR